jgi:hypothetical protein
MLFAVFCISHESSQYLFLLCLFYNCFFHDGFVWQNDRRARASPAHLPACSLPESIKHPPWHWASISCSGSEQILKRGDLDFKFLWASMSLGSSFLLECRPVYVSDGIFQLLAAQNYHRLSYPVPPPYWKRSLLFFTTWKFG